MQHTQRDVEQACERAGCEMFACDEDGADFGILFDDEPMYYAGDRAVEEALEHIRLYSHPELEEQA